MWYRSGSDSDSKRFVLGYIDPDAWWDLENARNGTAIRAEEVLNEAYNYACEQWCRPCKKHKIDLFGYSRGAAIALQIAKKLETEGCDCKNQYGRLHGVYVRYLGLIDTIDRAASLGITADYVPQNVEKAAHAYRDGTADNTDIWQFWKNMDLIVGDPNRPQRSEEAKTRFGAHFTSAVVEKSFAKDHPSMGWDKDVAEWIRDEAPNGVFN